MSKLIIEEIQNRLHKKNKNWLCVITGSTGSGKSYTSLKLAQLIDPKFSINNVVFTAREFMGLLNGKKLRRGSVVVWDEAGVGIPAKEWFSLSNRCVSYVTQTFRHRNIALIMTVPDYNFIDKSIRSLFHTKLETIRIDRRKRRCICKWLNIQYNDRYGKPYYKYPRIVEGGMTITLPRMEFPKPKPRLLRAYEHKKKLFTAKLNKDIEQQLISLDVQKEERVKMENRPPIEDLAKIVLKKKKKLMGTRGRLDYTKLMAEFDIGEPSAKKLRAYVETH